jgi:TrmH family RNA methyltransferase
MNQIGISHEKIKLLRNLKKKSQKNLVVVEGLGVLDIAIKNKIDIISIFYCDELIYSDDAIKIKDKCIKLANETYEISKKTYESIADKDNSGGLIAITKYNALDIDKVDFNKHNLILVLNGIELPGNLGTIYRSAYASNIDLIINVDNITDIYNPKFISSSRGVLFGIPTINTTYEEVQEVLLNNNYRILLGEPLLGTSYHNFNYEGKIAIVVGSERFGINKNWYDHKHEKIYIPMKDDMKSINVGVAASILMYEASINKGKI